MTEVQAELHNDEVVATAEGVIEGQAEAGKIVNFMVGVQGSSVYRVASSEELSLRDMIEGVSTIEINTIASFVENENPIDLISMYLAMKGEIVKTSLQMILQGSTVPEDVQAQILELL